MIQEESATPPPAPASSPRPKNKGFYILPNLFTSAGLFAGFYAIVQAMNGKFEHAAIAIFIAMICDSMDGRVARLTHTQSEFGVQYDSLSDMVSFGIAPALVAYAFALQPLHKFGWIAAFIYAVGAALRLARFNVQTGTADKRWFTGLPSPAAAALIAGFVWTSDYFSLSAADLRGVTAAIAIFAGLTMVSNVKYNSFKALNFRKSVPFMAVLLPVAAILLVMSNPPVVLFAVFVAYACSGYIGWGVSKVFGHKTKEEPVG